LETIKGNKMADNAPILEISQFLILISLAHILGMVVNESTRKSGVCKKFLNRENSERDLGDITNGKVCVFERLSPYNQVN
jgi:hypothetical protein